jgi:hypothetical protein
VQARSCYDDDGGGGGGSDDDDFDGDDDDGDDDYDDDGGDDDDDDDDDHDHDYYHDDTSLNRHIFIIIMILFLFSVSLHDVTSAHASGSDNTGDSLICVFKPITQDPTLLTPNIRTSKHHYSSNPKPQSPHPRRKRVHVAVRGGTGSFSRVACERFAGGRGGDDDDGDDDGAGGVCDNVIDR